AVRTDPASRLARVQGRPQPRNILCFKPAVRDDDRLPAVSARAFGRKNRRPRGALLMSEAWHDRPRGATPTAAESRKRRRLRSTSRALLAQRAGAMIAARLVNRVKAV